MESLNADALGGWDSLDPASKDALSPVRARPMPTRRNRGSQGRTRTARRTVGAPEVIKLQRARIITAVIAVVEEGGYSRLTVAKVISRAKVSRKTFYEIFANGEDCFDAAFEQILQGAREMLRDAYAGELDWRAAMRAAMLSLLSFMDQERGLARLCIVESLLAGPAVLKRRDRALGELARAISMGDCESRRVPQPLTSEAILGGVFGVLHQRLLAEDPAPLTDLLNPLMGMIVLPYLGPAIADDECARPKPQPLPAPEPPASRPARASVNPLEGVDMRLTYRTVRVLTAIAGAPGASNRQIAQDAGIVDQGQISKLLRRLAGLGLIENSGPGHRTGGSNAWGLTKLGAQLHRATRGTLGI
jgi:AcrR family transcriptional regulator